MIRNYLKIALRSLVRYRLTAFINLFGLTLGLTCCLLILAYVLHETSYDRYSPKADRTYRISRDFLNNEGEATFRLAAVAPPVQYYIQNDFPEIEEKTVLLPNGQTSLKYQDKLFAESNTFFADENVFDVFPAKVLSGSPKRGLLEPFTVMLEEKTAERYFGQEDPIGKVVRIGGTFDAKVGGVFGGFPDKAHLHPSILISFSSLNDTTLYGEKQLATNWGNNAFLTYVVLAPGHTGAGFEAKLPAFIDRRKPADNPAAKPSKFTRLLVTPLTDIHLKSHRDDEVEPPGDTNRVYIFSIIAGFILLIACINYMNLSTARATLRAREIGVRKVIGAQRWEIVAQFLTESVLMTYAAMILAFAATAITLPLLGKLAGLNLAFGDLMTAPVLLPLAAMPIVVGLLSGIYPALFMSAFRPHLILKGIFKAGQGGLSFRRVLVVVQFSISIILIISTAVVLKQLRYMHNKPLGISRDQIVVLPYQTQLTPGFSSFRNELLSDPGFRQMGRSSRVPSGRLLDDMGAMVKLEGKDFKDTRTPIRYVSVDKDFVPTYGIGMAAGRNFGTNYKADSSGFIINEAAVRMVGWKSNQDAIGQPMNYGPTSGKVIGVVKDFHFESLHQAITPMILILGDGKDGYTGFNGLSVKMDGNNVAGHLSTLEAAWKKYYPELPFSYTFLDDKFERLYQAEQRQGTLFTLFACIAIFVACLGLLGLTAFAITQRIKEIGIRKVLGASVANITGLLSQDFLRLVLVASVIAFPVAWYAMSRWLEGFAYRIDIPWWVFLLSGAVTVTIALITIATQTISAASANPVKSLRTE